MKYAYRFVREEGEGEGEERSSSRIYEELFRDFCINANEDAREKIRRA